MSTLELRDRMGQAIRATDELIKRSQAESRDLTPEEQVIYDRQWADYTSLKAQAERIEAHERARQDLMQIVPNLPVQEQKVLQGDRRATQEYRDAFIGYVRTGNALQVGANDEGGYTVPTTMLARLVELGREMNVVRPLCQVIQTANTTTIPTVAANSIGYWKAEEAAFVQGEGTFGQASLGAYKATGLIKISEELLQDSGVDIEGFITRNIAETLGALEEQAFLVGDGNIASVAPINGFLAGTPQASSSGITTASATAITAAETMDMYYALAPRFRRNASWILKDSTVKLLRKLVEGTTGQFLWQPGMTAGDPDTLYGRPVYTSEYMPAATAGLRSVLFGDFNYALIGDRSPVAIQRLNELYAGNGQIGFKAWKRVDLAVTQPSAIQYSTMHA